VAEHSLLVAANVPPKHQPWALLHDAAEAYIADVARPVKHHFSMEGYRATETEILSAVLTRFELADWMPASVRLADNRALMTERRDLMPTSEYRWDEELEALDAFPTTIWSYEPSDIEDDFLKMARGLGLQ